MQTLAININLAMKAAIRASISSSGASIWIKLGSIWGDDKNVEYDV